MKLWKYVREQMLKNPMQTVCENEAVMTYEGLVIYAEQFAKRLEGIKCCAILCQSEMAAAMALLACFAAGVTALPLSQRYGKHHCNKILDVISPDGVIIDLEGNLQALHFSDAEFIPQKENPALIMCTSGTTGVPKGAMLTEKNVITNVKDIADYFAMDTTDTILIARPLYHCAVLTGEFLTALVKGVKIRFYSGAFNPTEMLNMLEKYSITTFCGTPTLLGMMVRLKREKKGTKLRYICVSGECLEQEAGKRIANAFPQAQIYHVYGLTEACPRVSYLPPELFVQYMDCAGIPLKSVSLKILKDKRTTAEINEVGVLWVKGENVMAGYYNNPQKTARVLKRGWLCTGDLALINEAGLLEIKGRIDDLIIKAGMNIYPKEIENAVRKDPRVVDVYVWGEDDEKLGKKIRMHITGDFSSISEVKALCVESLPPYQVPTKIDLCKEMPINGSGKIIRGKNYVGI